uniref:E3 ubiquitin-protein ligase CIP8 n=1 Tax=Erigeron canadensis TaxID=72917 RepID=UPI001CB89E74|nr:E3 ubiquitin-protein ligase CIP8 [Erigeron canadensis]
MDDALSVENFDPPRICALCHRMLSSENDPIDLENMSICGDCKFLFLEENGTPSQQHVPRMTSRIRRARYNNSSESIEDMFSQQFSTMITLARHNPPAISDTSTRTTPNGSRRWRRVVSDTESEGFDSVNGESDVISYGYDSEASVDVHSFLGGDSDTDIDPMHAGLNQWSSDEEDVAWEEVENSENTLGSLIARVQLQRSMVSDGQFSETEGSIRVRISERRQVHVTNPFGNTDDDHETLPYVGNSGDYLDARSFEELLERLAEADNTRRGAPPASLSFVKNLDCVVVNATDHNGLACAICKDTLTVGAVVNRLPCLHLYHRPCIKPWLSARNTCPLCRFELPTDDMDYENRKQINSHVSGVQEVEQQVEDTSFEEPEGQIIINTNSEVDTGSERGRWLFMAAPLVSLVGIGLALWLGNRGAITTSGSCVSNQRANRSRRWWGLF